jgi:uroporphyrin-III C-methyltransferase/precorrin-2 dehydrogenase/sirohydrochlorin ferrochelatase
MDYFPIFAKLRGRPCLVVGGGTVATRKVRQLLKSGARITVNAPVLNDELSTLAADGAINHHRGSFEPTVIANHLLIIAATSDPEINHEVAVSARQANRLCNVVDDADASGFIMPSVVDRSPVMVAISSGGRSPVLATLLRQRLDDWLPLHIGTLARWAGKWRDTVRNNIPAATTRLRFWQTVLDGDPAERILAGKSAEADQSMVRALSSTAHRSRRGEAWIVGAGPGDPGLITRRGMYLLQRADVILHDRLVAPEILDLARRDAEIIDVGKRAGQPSATQADINGQLVDLVRQGHRVCRLKGGDPFIFGRGGEEVSALARAGLPYQVVPGISAANGCAAYAGIPLTHRDLAGAVTLVAGHRSADQDDIDWPELAALRHTLVIYMGGRQLADICRQLAEHGRAPDTPAAIIANGTTREQQVIGGTLENLAARATDADVGSPALLIVGAVVDLADKLEWYQPATVESQQPIAETSS